jgi:endonuclease VIII
VPEGDTILRAKNRLSDALLGQTLTVSAPNPRGRAAGVERLDGRVLERIDTHGKHLLLGFGDLVLHSHLGMSGSWRVYAPGDRWRRPRDVAWVVLGGGQSEAAQFNGPTLRVMRRGRVALDPQLARLGHDILAPEFNLERVASAVRHGDPGRVLGESLLDQTLVAGIGNIFKNEGCFAVHLNPWRTLGDTSDAELRSVLQVTRELMLVAVAEGRHPFQIYKRRGPCIRCGGRVQISGQGDANRTTWWCAGCQH